MIFRRNRHDDEYEDVYDVDAKESYTNGGYTENGDGVYCTCGGEMEFVEEMNCWKCQDCGTVVNRAQWFNDIGAHLVPGKKCLTKCRENYPVCKNWCMLYKIPDDDPIL